MTRPVRQAALSVEVGFAGRPTVRSHHSRAEFRGRVLVDVVGIGQRIDGRGGDTCQKAVGSVDARRCDGVAVGSRLLATIGFVGEGIKREAPLVIE